MGSHVSVVLACVAVCASAAGNYLSTASMTSVLTTHNQYRSDVPSAANMIRLEWSNVLQLTAQNYVKNCVFQHNSNRTAEAQGNALLLGYSTSLYSYVGENLYWTSATGGQYGVSAVSSWNSENSSYTYTTVTSTNFAATGHYTQNIWANTQYVGCAQYDCTGTSLGGTIVLCNYATGYDQLISFLRYSELTAFSLQWELHWRIPLRSRHSCVSMPFWFDQ
jgi:hypothetical protein